MKIQKGALKMWVICRILRACVRAIPLIVEFVAACNLIFFFFFGLHMQFDVGVPM